jgi:hypothetical protein
MLCKSYITDSYVEAQDCCGAMCVELLSRHMSLGVSIRMKIPPLRSLLFSQASMRIPLQVEWETFDELRGRINKEWRNQPPSADTISAELAAKVQAVIAEHHKFH